MLETLLISTPADVAMAPLTAGGVSRGTGPNGPNAAGVAKLFSNGLDDDATDSFFSDLGNDDLGM